MKKENEIIKGFKGLDKDFKCRGFQFEEGKEYETDDAVVCQEGFHFYTDPFDVLNYYPIAESTLAASGDSSKLAASGDSRQLAASGDSRQLAASGHYSKLAASGDSSQLAASGHYSQLAASGHYSKLAASGHYSQLAASGHYSQLAASGHYSKLAASGDSSKLAASGHSSQLEMTGKDSVGANIGIEGTIKGKIGCWIILAEYKNNKPVCVKSTIIDDKKIKADTFYKLQKGKFVEVK